MDGEDPVPPVWATPAKLSPTPVLLNFVAFTAGVFCSQPVKAGSVSFQHPTCCILAFVCTCRS